ncbi:MAG: Protein often near L-alanine-DL-glutamate epimerase (cell wall recycling) [Cytophagales bacterium]|jgi:uncharacterized NAD-dependent epimerase/dehydratase family protein|nr:DUF1611 domain-containing protein [Bacteroidota bacterium]MBS1979659.1 DUF1611 domain-containing protein [Bacteroidota bacterium]WHZ06912.1 MAG: Protein often near L-alanine-DL-glutamate epimerase (cell wall recycling) [Cytophagales bacterium]
MPKSNALIITAGYLNTEHGKTAHGLIRGTERFNILGVIDKKHPGQDAGEVLDGKKRNIPVYASLKEFAKQSKKKVKFCIIGVATKGGVLPKEFQAMLREAISMGYGIVNGLHDYVSDHPDLVALAKKKKVQIVDVRKPKKFKDLHFWSGDISKVKCPKIAVLGTDCALGKRTTTRFLMQAMRAAGYKAEMIYTGQTGWMQGAKYGFIFDSTLNDFISGEMEHAIVKCWREAKPDIIFIEGQSSLRNPSGPAGSEWIVSADADAAILQHNPPRKKYKGLENYKATIPDVKDEIDLIKIYGAPTVAVTVNSLKMKEAEAREWATTKENELGIPVILPLEDGVEKLVPLFEKMIKKR